eukprot:TRINITY_DN39158_c0_g1_i1.p1 TRINITY_DN39158_c0_g1~~TRINITY_DN39158_c0_g1_i1.p1  ORF type:complete len:137 (-),score=22.69 TRINITY_DN39158_c0_g1_i1:8-418(-)
MTVPGMAMPGPTVCISSQKETKGLVERIGMQKILGCYMALIFTCRLYLRSSHASGLHWALVMILEDGMSFLSFALALMYLHHRNGAPLALLAKCFAAHAEGVAPAPLAGDEESESFEARELSRHAEKRIRLFSIAL